MEMFILYSLIFGIIGFMVDDRRGMILGLLLGIIGVVIAAVLASRKV